MDQAEKTFGVAAVAKISIKCYTFTVALVNVTYRPSKPFCLFPRATLAFFCPRAFYDSALAHLVLFFFFQEIRVVIMRLHIASFF